MSNIVDFNKQKANPFLVANGAASRVEKKGAFYVFSLRLSDDDIREYSFTNRDRAVSMRRVLIGHMEQKLIQETKRVIGA